MSHTPALSPERSLSRRNRAREIRRGALGEGRAPLPEDGELVRRLIAGDDALFACVVGRYQPLLTRLARRWVRTEAAAEETVQDTWLAVLAGLWRFEGRSAFRTWVFSILANRARTRAVRDSRLVPLTEFDATARPPARDDDHRTQPDALVASPAPSAESQAITRQLVGLIRSSMDSLPSTQRAVLALRYVEELDATEVATRLGLTGGHQRVILHRARGSVRRALELRLQRGRHGHSSATSAPPGPWRSADALAAAAATRRAPQALQAR